MTNKELFEGMENALDAMISELNHQMAIRDKLVEEMCKNDPSALLRYKNAMFKLDKWIKANPFKMPPDAEYFLK